MQTLVTSHGQNVNVGTLLWIGPRNGGEFAPPHRFCETTASQIAWRPSIQVALRRPASDVRCIVIAQDNRASISEVSLASLAKLYPDASRLNLLGSMCEGVCRYPVAYFGGDRHYWHRWNQILPDFVRSCGVVDQSGRRATSVLILASRFTDAETLLDLAESTGATAVWSRSSDTMRVRNVDAVWWDESVVTATTAETWMARTRAIGNSAARHAWIASGIRADQWNAAIAGGVERIVSKPYRIEPLIEMLCQNAQKATHAGIVRAA